MSTGLETAVEDRVLATAQQIVKSLNTPKEVREDMLLIFSSFDNRLSNITDLIKDESNARLDAAEKLIFRWDTSTADSSRHTSLPWDSDSEEAYNYLSAIDDVLQLIEDFPVRVGDEIMDRAYSTIQIAMSRLEEEFRHLLITNTVPLDSESIYAVRRTRIHLPVRARVGLKGRRLKVINEKRGKEMKEKKRSGRRKMKIVMVRGEKPREEEVKIGTI